MAAVLFSCELNRYVYVILENRKILWVYEANHVFTIHPSTSVRLSNVVRDPSSSDTLSLSTNSKQTSSPPYYSANYHHQ